MFLASDCLVRKGNIREIHKNLNNILCQHIYGCFIDNQHFVLKQQLKIKSCLRLRTSEEVDNILHRLCHEANTISRCLQLAPVVVKCLWASILLYIVKTFDFEILK